MQRSFKHLFFSCCLLFFRNMKVTICCTKRWPPLAKKIFNILQNTFISQKKPHTNLSISQQISLFFSVNTESKAGSVGFASVLFPGVYPVRLIRVDENGDVVRDPTTGCATICKPHETGEFVGKIIKVLPSNQALLLYGFIKSRLWKSRSKSGTRLLLDFC